MLHLVVRSSSLLVLWDVDGTLIDNGGISKYAYALGFELLTGRLPVEPVVTDGMTDIAIMRLLFERHGLELDPYHVRWVPEVMAEALASLVPLLRERGHAMPGAAEALEALAIQPGVVQSVLTGNVAPNARAKVAAFGLDARLDFEVGGYGSDDEIRANLVGVAQAKASASYGAVFDSSNTVLIGDTLRDVEPGRVGGAHVVAVASGAFTVDQLSAAGADVVLPDLRDTDAVVKSVLGSGPRIWETKA